eukprot:3878817-Alexandrium_andersonii.AAC.1
MAAEGRKVGVVFGKKVARELWVEKPTADFDGVATPGSEDLAQGQLNRLGFWSGEAYRSPTG